MRRFMVLGLLWAMLATPALAADLGGDNRGSFKDDVPYAPSFSWTGGYAGLQLGYGWADTEALSGPAGAFNQSYDYGTDGFVGGGHIGYNIQAGPVVYGIEADLELSDVNGSGVGSIGNSHQTDIDWQGSIRARLGYAADRSLFYITGGWAFADVSITSASGALSNSETRDGWTLGGGYEYAVTNNMTARLEYRYTDLGSNSFSGGGLVDDSDVTTQAIRAGVSMKF